MSVLGIEVIKPRAETCGCEVFVFGWVCTKLVETPPSGIWAASDDHTDDLAGSKRQRLRRFQNAVLVTSFNPRHGVTLARGLGCVTMRGLGV